MRGTAVVVVVFLVGIAGLASAAPRSRDRVHLSFAGDAVRTSEAELLRHRFAGALVLADAEPAANRSFDVAVTSNVQATRRRLEVTVEVRVVISDERGKMLAVVTATANANGSLRTSSIATLRDQATADALQSIVGRMRAARPRLAI